MTERMIENRIKKLREIEAQQKELGQQRENANLGKSGRVLLHGFVLHPEQVSV